ncbi:DUF58 domain-containing protein [Tardiphaga sp. OK246]|uniref:DUF58 domain-containing protein n=1 Tax=Tardiphaga sp. OK246 TaxID=1855307 RepID=UPI0024C077AB|nr:DUF58 domain-containing protein [Tardiphaga sp. OK246]
MDALAAFETAARDFSFLRRQPVHSLLSGRHGSRVRGRGLAFEELRKYLPGDDIRTMDWHVTARTGKPYIRVYTEEKDRPTIVVVDQRINMFFGSVRSTKSVAAAEVAALVAWRSLGQGDRVGGLIFGDTQIETTRPHRSREAVMRLATAIAGANKRLSAGGTDVRTPAQLNVSLDAVAGIARHEHLVVIVSDFDGHDGHTHDVLLRMAGTNDVIAVLVYDPFLLKLPPSGVIVVSDGDLQVELGLTSRNTRQSLADFADVRAKEILAWHRELGVMVLPISAAEEVAPQMRRLLGQVTRQGRGR